MKRLRHIWPYMAILAVVVWLFFPARGFAQGGTISGPTFGPMGLKGGVAVTVCAAGATVSGGVCTPAESDANCCFSDSGLTQRLAVPAAPNQLATIVSDGLGNFTVWAAPGKYQISYSGAGVIPQTFQANVSCVPGGTNCTGLGAQLNGNNTFTGINQFTNAGVFTNTQMNEYVTSLINGCSPSTEFFTTQSSFATEGVDGCVLSGAGSTVHQTNGVSGFVNNASTTTNAVGVYGQGRATANSAKVWGFNTVTLDNAGITGAQLTGGEIDVNANNVSATVEGLLIEGGSSAQPSGQAIGIVLNQLGGGVTWNTGLQINANAVTSTGFGILMNSGIFGTNQVTSSGANQGDAILRNGNYLRGGSQLNNATFRLIGANSANHPVVDADAQGWTTPGQMTSTLATGTAPFVVASTTPVANLVAGGNTVTIASGTATMTTAAIASLACGTTVTVSATNVLTTDAIDFSFNAAPAANPGELTVSAWPTAGNVNFQYCNPTAGSVTPSAATLNWRVPR